MLRLVNYRVQGMRFAIENVSQEQRSEKTQFFVLSNWC